MNRSVSGALVAIAMTAASLLTACAALEPTPATDGGAGPGQADGSLTAGEGGSSEDSLAAADAGARDPGCLPINCDDLGLECGEVDDGCGGIALCGQACDGAETCGGGGEPNQCGCTPRSCEQRGGAGPAACGVVDDCGEPLDCGGCAGAQEICVDRACVCVPRANPCGDAQCGSATDGCGVDFLCGSNGGGCLDDDLLTCSASGECACSNLDAVATEALCAARGRSCGILQAGGCEVDCGPCDAECAGEGSACGDCDCGEALVCDSAAACCAPASPAIACGESRVCGDVLDGCAGIVSCGTCSEGAQCVEGACVDPAIAMLAGRYVVRTHAFREVPILLSTTVNRGEVISIVEIFEDGGALRMRDYGCVATSRNENDTIFTRVPGYHNIVPTEIPLSVVTDGDGTIRWLRDYVIDDSGWSRGEPPYCDGGVIDADSWAYDTDYNTHSPDDMAPEHRTGGSRATKPWLNGACTCPAGDLDAMPAGNHNNNNDGTVTDCRVNDVDRDGAPGLTVEGRALGLDSVMRMVSKAEIRWEGVTDVRGYHSGYATEPPSLETAILRCSGTCGAADDGTSCGAPRNRIQFIPMPETMLACDDFYTNFGGGGQAVDQVFIDSLFGPFQACDGENLCPSGSQCQGAQCWPMTSAGACDSDGDCPAGDWHCLGESCWPTGATCDG